jgi:flagellar hook-length control protein FliK
MDWQELAKSIWEVLQQMDQFSELPAMDSNALQDILSEMGLARSDMADLTKALQENQPEMWMRKLTRALKDRSQSQDDKALQQAITSLGRAMGLSKEDMGQLVQLVSKAKGLSSERMQDALRILFEGARDLQQLQEASRPVKDRLVHMLRLMEGISEGSGKQSEEKIARLAHVLKQILDSASGQGQQANQLSASQMSPKKAASEAMVDSLHKGVSPSRSEAGEQAGTKQPQSQHIAQEEALQDRSGQEQGSQRFGEHSGKEKERAWEALWNRVTKTTEEGSGMQDRGLGSLQQKMDSLLKESLGRGDASSRETLRHPEVRQGILRQVQSGLLRGIGQGRQELTLKLHPPELGRLHVVLQVHQNQVSAMIKTDNPDVTRALHHQLAGLQHNLEQQGLKVQKIDVQTQLSQQEQSGQQWFGEHGHNEAREQREKMEKRSWWQRWRGGPDTEDEIIHPQEETLERTATQGLSVIA